MSVSVIDQVPHITLSLFTLARFPHLCSNGTRTPEMKEKIGRKKEKKVREKEKEKLRGKNTKERKKEK